MSEVQILSPRLRRHTHEDGVQQLLPSRTYRSMNHSALAAHLQLAHREIQHAERLLNGRSHACTTCGLTVREDFAEYQLRLQLEAMCKKLVTLLAGLAMP